MIAVGKGRMDIMGCCRRFCDYGGLRGGECV
jgi:hypothetical protein